MKRHVAIVAGLIALGMCPPVTVQAATVVPGAPMLLYQAPKQGSPAPVEPWICSQGPNGVVTFPDGTTARIMISAGHCAKAIANEGASPSKEVVVPTQGGDVTVGTVDRARVPLEGSAQKDDVSVLEVVDDSLNSPDYATVKLKEEARTSSVATSVDEDGHRTSSVPLTTVRDYSDIPSGQVSFENFGDLICYKGQTSGGGCGTQLLRSSNGVWSVMPYEHGDSGGINYDPTTGEVIGISSMSFGPIGRAMPVDKALEDAYGIADGQVNKHFQVSDSQEGMDPMVPMKKRVPTLSEQIIPGLEELLP